MNCSCVFYITLFTAVNTFCDAKSKECESEYAKQ